MSAHRASMALSFAAFALFSVNEFVVLAWGVALDLSGPIGAAALMGFLGVGMLVQIWKFIEGHKGKVDALVTFVMLPLHVAAALTIWFRTQINHVGLPAELPLILVGVYWVVGLIEVLARYIGRELQLFKRDYKSPETLLLEAQYEIKELKTASEHEREMLKASLKVAERQLEATSKVYAATCEGCGKVYEGATQQVANQAVGGHKPHCKGVLAPNGHKVKAAAN